VDAYILCKLSSKNKQATNNISGNYRCTQNLQPTKKDEKIKGEDIQA
jgi:hypothetical protein